jgi:C4-dicarboxylate transporter DctM subunit
MFTIAFILSLITLVISVPIFLVFGLGSSIAAVGGLNLPWSVLIQVSFGALTKHVLIAVPLFIFAGMAMLKGGAASRLVKFTTTLVGHLAWWIGCGHGYCYGFFCSFLWINFSSNNCCRHNHDAKND